MRRRSRRLQKRSRPARWAKSPRRSGNYNAPASTEKKREGERPDEYRLRNWLWDRALSGDILVEQNIHIIDLCNWMLGAQPLKATATGGRNMLTHFGDCWDNYQVDFTYPEDVHFSFASTQFGSDGVFDAGLKLFGASGSATVPYAGPIAITGANAWTWQDSESNSGRDRESSRPMARFSDNLKYADRDKERTFIASIISGPAHNQIADGVETALSCMLGPHGRPAKARSDLGGSARSRRELPARVQPRSVRLRAPKRSPCRMHLIGCNLAHISPIRI